MKRSWSHGNRWTTAWRKTRWTSSTATASQNRDPNRTVRFVIRCTPTTTAVCVSLVEDSPSPLPASETPPPRTPPPITPLTASPFVQIVCSSVRPPPPLPHPSSPSSSVSRLIPSSTPAVAPPLMAHAPPLFLTQTAGGTFLLPAAPGTRHATPILLTTQGFPVMNQGTPLVLNLQPGQKVQPLTLIQSPSLGQLVRPSVGVSPVVQTRTGPAPSRGPAHHGSAFTAMQLPATLTFRTGTPGPVNLQMTQVGGANSLKLAASPALPFGSANGVTRISPFSSAPGPAPSVITAHSVTSALSLDPPRVVMSVEEFYYGMFEGDLSLRKPLPLGIKTSTFTCQICTYLAENNLRLMQHMLHHSELVGGRAAGEERKCCKFCYRQFSSPAQLQSHQEQVHGPALSSCLCRICEWAFENEPAFLNHMKSNHKPGEMPYVCQVCSYRSSFYSDILQHFASFHRDSRFLMCLFCLKVTRNPISYQQHLLRHQMNQAFHCNRCRLQFIFLKDKMQHKLETHRSFRRPAQLEGLPPGSKVTIRTYGKIRPLTLPGSRLLQSPVSLIQPINIKTERSPLQRSPGLHKSPRSPTKRPGGRRIHVNRSSSCHGDHLVCLECGTTVLDFSAHYPTRVQCLLCPYSSCCSRAYASHMIHHHVPHTKDKVVPLHRLSPPCVFLLRCSHCDFSPQTADQMAEHLLRNPEHHSTTCQARSKTSPQTDRQTTPRAHRRTETHTHRRTETHTHRRTETHTHRRTETHTHRRTETHTHRRTETHTHRRTETLTHRRTETLTHRRTETHTHRRTETHTHRRTETLTHSQTDRDTHSLTDGQRHSLTHRRTETLTHSQTDRDTHSLTDGQRHSLTHRRTE
ncbi:uncharacterized protein LOC142934042, partial [Anarhichas minor]|uniref:uncharacterized protein LOC142934042 n=1 Tax=Anarhichas minor TaxID=65739 RepID=UPI003F737958